MTAETKAPLPEAIEMHIKFLEARARFIDHQCGNREEQVRTDALRAHMAAMAEQLQDAKDEAEELQGRLDDFDLEERQFSQSLIGVILKHCHFKPAPQDEFSADDLREMLDENMAEVTRADKAEIERLRVALVMARAEISASLEDEGIYFGPARFDETIQPLEQIDAALALQQSDKYKVTHIAVVNDTTQGELMGAGLRCRCINWKPDLPCCIQRDKGKS